MIFLLFSSLNMHILNALFVHPFEWGQKLVVAMSISMWYFTKEKKNVGNRVFFKAVYLSSLYHLGTCAFGSLIIGRLKRDLKLCST